MSRLFSLGLAAALLAPAASAAEPSSDLAKRLAGVKLERFADAPAYAEGPTWRNGELFFGSGALLRVDAKRQVHKYLEIQPTATLLRGDGHLLVCDNRHKALLDVSPEGKVGVLVELFETYTLRSLHDLTIDPRGNVYWTDPAGSSVKNPVGQVFRVRPDGPVDRVATGLTFPTGIAVDPAGKYLYVIESQAKKVLRYPLPADNDLCGKPEVFHDLGDSGGLSCAFDAAGNLWVADSGQGRLTVLGPDATVLAHLPVPAGVVSGIAFGGPEHDEIFCTTGDPTGVYHARVGVKGFAGHPGKPMPVVRRLNLVALRPHAETATLGKIAEVAAAATVDGSRPDADSRKKLQSLIANLNDAQVRGDLEKLQLLMEQAIVRHAHDRVLLAEITRLGGKATLEIQAPDWLRSFVGDEGLQVFGRIVEIDLNERTDGHKEPTPKKLSDRVTDDWLKFVADQADLRRLELSGTAVTSAGLVHLKNLMNLERLNVCLTAVDDRGFEHLAGLTKMRRMTVCSSKITGSGFAHLQAMKELESINLHSSPANDAGLEAIGKLTSLRRLEIVHTKVTDAGLKHLAGLVNLRQLHVHGPETTAAALPFLGQLQELYQLDVYDRAASNETLEQVGKLPKLRFLMLPNGIFDDDGVKHLAKLVTLEELTLDSSKVTDASIDHLAGLTNLRKLHLGRARLSTAGRERLKTLLPKVETLP